MNEEEKNAIDFLKETNFDYLEYDMCVSSVEIISNLVERLQKENEELKNQEATQRKINELLVQRYSNSILSIMAFILCFVIQSSFAV
jgi:hypothetical protein